MHYAGFVEVHVPADENEKLVDALNAISDLSVQSVAVNTSPNSLTNQLTVDVMGNDKAGKHACHMCKARALPITFVLVDALS